MWAGQEKRQYRLCQDNDSWYSVGFVGDENIQNWVSWVISIVVVARIVSSCLFLTKSSTHMTCVF